MRGQKDSSMQVPDSPLISLSREIRDTMAVGRELRWVAHSIGGTQTFPEGGEPHL